MVSKKAVIDKVEQVQKRAIKLTSDLSKRSHSDRLKVFNFRTLKYRRYCGDMFELFKTIKGIYDPICVPDFDFDELSND